MFTLFSTVLPLMFFHPAECHHEMIVHCSKVLSLFSATTRQHSDVGESPTAVLYAYHVVRNIKGYHSKSNVGKSIKLLRFFDDLTNCENVFGCTSSSSETSLSKAAVVVEGWSDAFQKDNCKQPFRGWRVGLCRDGLSIPPCFLCSSKKGE